MKTSADGAQTPLFLVYNSRNKLYSDCKVSNLSPIGRNSEFRDYVIDQSFINIGMKEKDVRF